MKKTRLMVMLLVVMTIVLCIGCGGESKSKNTFSKHTKNELFKDIPAMSVEGTTVSDAVDYGDDNYVITITGTKVEDYKSYLSTLEKDGYKKHVDNGEGFDAAVFGATYTKGNKVVTVVHLDRAGRTYVSVGQDKPLSDHLFYDESYVANNKEGAQTKLHMTELYYFGSGFILQLKNGNFIINDGGTDYDTPYLLDYLESLTPEGQKPVVEAWVISHAHYDHSRVLQPIATEEGYADRIIVEGFYFNEPSDAVNKLENTEQEILYIKSAARKLQTSDGGHPEVYRLHTGQRYYFNDITMDVSLSQEQLLLENYKDGFNESSTWLLYTIDGQTLMIGGDSGPAGMLAMMEAYSENYMTFNHFSGLHHGFNSRNDFAVYTTVTDVVMYSFRGVPRGSSNSRLEEGCKEVITYETGTKIITFPYTEGSIEELPATDWIYNVGQTRPSL